jgi:hypothetical protein
MPFCPDGHLMLLSKFCGKLNVIIKCSGNTLNVSKVINMSMKYAEGVHMQYKNQPFNYISSMTLYCILKFLIFCDCLVAVVYCVMNVVFCTE